jgi:hypothetical protein
VFIKESGKGNKSARLYIFPTLDDEYRKKYRKMGNSKLQSEITDVASMLGMWEVNYELLSIWMDRREEKVSMLRMVLQRV